MSEPMLIETSAVPVPFVPPPCREVWLVRYVSRNGYWTWLRNGGRGSLSEFTTYDRAAAEASKRQAGMVVRVPAVHGESQAT